MYLSLGPDTSTCRNQRFQALKERLRVCVQSEVGDLIDLTRCQQDEEWEYCIVWGRGEPFDLEAPASEQNAIRTRMADDLIVFRHIVQPHLDRVMQAEYPVPERNYAPLEPLQGGDTVAGC